ncbi:conserved hypothetical protein [Ricinus communis]|uniref:Uncharacterized protein n=1 Tax=Ricinus communis TaxID=3988 RepID=B9RKU4_RICCO|nr:conserved hypothetical protein [Ricinus communis]
MDPKLEELSHSYKELTSINEKQEKRVRHLETKLMWSVSSYVVAQGIVFLSISRPSNISCNKWWYPFFLALSVAIVFGLTFTTTISKWAKTQYQYELNLLDLEIIHYDLYLLKHGQTKIDALSNLQPDQSVLRPDMVRVYQRYAYIYVTAFALLGFSAVVLRACFTLVCN